LLFAEFSASGYTSNIVSKGRLTFAGYEQVLENFSWLFFFTTHSHAELLIAPSST